MFRHKFPPLEKPMTEPMPEPPKFPPVPEDDCCAHCPNWHLMLNAAGEPIRSEGALKRVGRCKAELPKMVVVSPTNVQTFPPMVEDDWCVPGLQLMTAQRTTEEQLANPPGRVYSEL